jgi:transcriptional regulator with XRE-family HTH domain
MSTSQVVAQLLRQEMWRQHVSGRELARRVGESPNWVVRRINGPTPIAVDELFRMAAALGRPAVEFLPAEDAA